MTISVPLLLWLWFAHWVGDFVLQSDAVARGKSKSNVVLTDHVAIYALTLMAATAPVYGLSSTGSPTTSPRGSTRASGRRGECMTSLWVLGRISWFI
jgi:hypothetical protein